MSGRCPICDCITCHHTWDAMARAYRRPRRPPPPDAKDEQIARLTAECEVYHNERQEIRALFPESYGDNNKTLIGCIKAKIAESEALRSTLRDVTAALTSEQLLVQRLQAMVFELQSKYEGSSIVVK